MTSENQALLDAIRGVVEEVVAPLADRIERIEIGHGALLESIITRLDSLEARLTTLEARMTSLETRMTSLEERVLHLEDPFERLDMRTAQISRELYELHERMDREFTSLKRETELALGQLYQGGKWAKDATETHQGVGRAGRTLAAAPGETREPAKRRVDRE
jgi:chromosome segregation ATPase